MDLLMLFYCKFKIFKLFVILLSFIYLIIFKKLEPVFYPKEFCSRCNSFNLEIENFDYLLFSFSSVQFANKHAYSSPIFKPFNFNICKFDLVMNGNKYFSMNDGEIWLLDKFKLMRLQLPLNNYLSNKIWETNS